MEYGEERTHEMTEADWERLELKKMLAFAASFYQKALFSEDGHKARLYLAERRLNKATVERFGLGWAPAGGAAAPSRSGSSYPPSGSGLASAGVIVPTSRILSIIRSISSLFNILNG